MIRWAESHPKDLAAALGSGSPVIWALGALEWHGDHLPLGLDTLTADWFSSQLAERVDGILYPTLTLPITTLPHAFSHQGTSGLVLQVWEETLSELRRSGVHQVMIVTGHYAQGHLMELSRLALRMGREAGLWCLASPPLGILQQDSLLDHAGAVETSQLLAIRPDLVRLDERDGLEAVLGEDPTRASASAGEALLDQALSAWTEAAAWDSKTLEGFLEGQIEGLRPYEEAWKTSTWEEAIFSWWKARRGQA
jgi:creatinine amidohydrolase